MTQGPSRGDGMTVANLRAALKVAADDALVMLVETPDDDPPILHRPVVEIRGNVVLLRPAD